MLSFALSHITDEQGINSAMMLCSEGAHMAFRLSRLVFHHSRKKHPKQAEATTEDPLLSDACSVYRGGYATTNDPEVQTLLQDLSGADEPLGAASDKPFFWLGDRSDLSYFWKKTERDTAVMLPRSMIDDISDEAMRRRVVSTLTQARIEGLVTLDGEAYFLTDAGRKQILKPEFIKTRLIKECEYLGIAYEGLAEEQKQRENDRIDKRLAELGRTGEFDGCDRITLNKKKLLIDDTAEDVTRFYIPYTHREKCVDLPKADLIELDAKTFAAFLRKGREYLVNGEPMQEAELFRCFDDKNKREAARIATAADRAEQSVIRAENVAHSNLQVDQKVYVLRPAGEDLDAQEYTVARITKSPDGNHLYQLQPADPVNTPLLLQEEVYGRVFFDSPESAMEYVASFPEDAYAHSALIDRLYTPENVLQIPAKYVEQANGEIHVHPKDAPYESIVFSTDVARLQPDGSAIVQLRPNASYTVQSGEVSYTVTQQGAQHLLQGVAKPMNETTRAAVKTVAGTTAQVAEKTVAATPVTQIAQPVTEVAGTGAQLMQGAAEPATTTVQAAAKTGAETAVKSMPGPVTQAAKLIVDAAGQAQKVAEVSVPSNSLSLKL